MMEVGLGIKLRVCEEVDQSSLLNKFVLTINTVVLKLFFGVSQCLVLNHFSMISPLVAKLLVFIVGICVVEDRELGTQKHGEVTDFHLANIVGNQEFMMPDHSSEPVIVLPTSHSRHGVNGCNV